MTKNKRTISIYLPEEVIEMLERVQSRRNDPTRSDTIRVLLLTKLAEMSYLSEDVKKALDVEGENE